MTSQVERLMGSSVGVRCSVLEFVTLCPKALLPSRRFFNIGKIRCFFKKAKVAITLLRQNLNLVNRRIA